VHDVLVVGSGFSGSILARKLAEEQNLKVLLIEQRSHIAGNMYDELDEHGILVQRYGPHLFSTDKFWTVEFLQQYAELVVHETKILSFIDGEYVRLPFNFRTVQQLVTPKKAEPLLAKLRKNFAGQDRISVYELIEHRDDDIRAYGELLFEKAYRTYTAKMWGLEPDQIDRSVLNRAMMQLGYDERYQNKDFQYLPKYGFTKLFEKMLDHPNIDIVLNCDAMKKLCLNDEEGKATYDGIAYRKIIFTGAIDELFSRKFGVLPYRSLDIHYRYEKPQKGPFALPCQVISYPQADGYTRDTEYKQINYIDVDTPYTVIAREFPMAYDKEAPIGNVPYYPVLNETNRLIFERYQIESMRYDNLFLCGRLADYKYYNMDLIIENAFEKYEILCKNMGLK
jgi:UDP-galactopyranose mutase